LANVRNCPFSDIQHCPRIQDLRASDKLFHVSLSESDLKALEAVGRTGAQPLDEQASPLHNGLNSEGAKLPGDAEIERGQGRRVAAFLTADVEARRRCWSRTASQAEADSKRIAPLKKAAACGSVMISDLERQ
jgi:hypothetical protein